MSLWLATLSLSLLYPVLAWLATLALLLMVFLPRRKSRQAVILMLSPVVALGLFAAAAQRHETLPSPPPGAPPGVWRVAHLNAYVGSNNTGARLAYIRQSRADVVSLVEVNGTLAKVLPELNEAYPYRYVFVRNVWSATPPRQHRLALLSRYPFRPVQSFGEDALLFEIDRPGGRVYHLTVHALSPTRPDHLARRNRVLADIAATPLPTPLTVAGDFNTTPWDPVLYPLHRMLSFHGSWLPTWPYPLPMVPMDLVWSKGAGLRHLVRVPVAGSDHLGVVADFTFDPL